MAKHQKHAKLKLRENDLYSPNEISILGTKCIEIQNLVSKICKELPKYKLAYLDSSHNNNLEKTQFDSFIINSNGTANISSEFKLNKFNQRIQFSQYDFVFINGNHFPASKQILILDDEKESSVLKRIDRLSEVSFIIKTNDGSKFFNFLVEKNPYIKNLKCYNISQIREISNHIENLIKGKITTINGLVLAGGKSLRMGKDKGKLNFYGKNQRDIAIELLEKNNIKTYLSVREEQKIDIENIITDKYINLGPFGAICSAFQKNPNIAWLVLATDLPFVNDKIIQFLLKNRNPSKIATAIKGKTKEFPEPLITIWEPKSYTLLLNYLAQGYSCPRKILINSDIEIVEVDDNLIRNINTPDDFDSAYKEING